MIVYQLLQPLKSRRDLSHVQHTLPNWKGLNSTTTTMLTLSHISHRRLGARCIISRLSSSSADSSMSLRRIAAKVSRELAFGNCSNAITLQLDDQSVVVAAPILDDHVEDRLFGFLTIFFANFKFCFFTCSFFLSMSVLVSSAPAKRELCFAQECRCCTQFNCLVQVN